MKIADRIVEFLQAKNFDEQAVLEKINNRIKDIGYDGFLQAIDAEFDGKGLEVILSDDEGDELEVYFDVLVDGEFITPVAYVYWEDENDLTSRVIYLPDNTPIMQRDVNSKYVINYNDFDWVDEDVLERILSGEDEEPVGDEDSDDYIGEAFTYVIRNGKKIKKKLVRQKRRRRLTPAQRQGIRKAVRSRRAKKSVIARHRKKSLKIRKMKNLKKNTNRRLKVQGTSSRKKI